MRLFERSFNMANINVKYSKGFNPHPRFSIASPLSLGIESEGEYMDIELKEELPIEEFIFNMNNVLPNQIQIIQGEYLPDKTSTASVIAWALYEISFPLREDIKYEDFESLLINWLLKEEILINRLRKRGRRREMVEEDIKGLIKSLDLKNIDNNIVIMEGLLKTGDNGNLRPLDMITSFNQDNNLDIDMDTVKLKRLDLFGEDYKGQPISL